MSVLMAGDGTPGGLVLGAIDRNGYAAIDRILSPKNSVSTVYTSTAVHATGSSTAQPRFWLPTAGEEFA